MLLIHDSKNLSLLGLFARMMSRVDKSSLEPQSGWVGTRSVMDRSLTVTSDPEVKHTKAARMGVELWVN